MGHVLDYIGFTYDGVHSSALKILRVSSGNRYDRNLFPTLEDSTVNVPGGDGMYYFGTNYRAQVFNIAFAYDSLLEEDITRLQRLFTGKKVCDLIFDELPYKVYSVKPTGNMTLKSMIFEEGPQGRIYKGEGSVALTAFYPYARSRYKWLEEYTADNITEWEKDKKGIVQTNINEWLAASGIIGKGVYDDYNPTTKGIPIFNPGDVDTDFNLIIPFNGTTIGDSTSGFNMVMDGSNFTQLHVNQCTKKGADAKIRINTRMNVIEGLGTNNKPTGNIYNDKIKSGNFFKLPTTGSGGATLLIGGITGTPTIEYNFLYI